MSRRKKEANVAYSVNPSEGGEVRAEKVVIVTGPSFGTTIKLILFGAALGAGAVLAWQKQNEKPLQPTLPGLDDEDSADEMASRLNSLAARAKTVANRARDLVQSAAEMAAPALQNAIAEGKKAARHVEEEIKDELREARESAAKDDKPEQV
jgi:hypothetical protein